MGEKGYPPPKKKKILSVGVGVINKVILKERKCVFIWFHLISVPLMYIWMKILVKEICL